MCGIAGAVALTRHADAAEVADVVAKMTTRLSHRGPDAGGLWSHAAGDVHLGHRRLAIVDLTEQGKQPMSFGDGRFWITFNGEIYNFRELARELEERGHRFTSTGDTQVLLAALAEWGLETALQRMTGMFAFALWDDAAGVLHLARDRMGEKPLHFGIIGDHLFFASEVRAFEVVPQFRAEVDHATVAAYLRFGYVPEPLSIYEGIYKLPPGTTLSIPARRAARVADVLGWWSGVPTPTGHIAPTRYWSCAEVAMTGREALYADAHEATREFETRLRESVRQQMVCDVPIGCFLSGGIDSSLVAAIMQAESTAPIHTFTVSFDRPEFDESAQARAIAAHLGTQHEEFVLAERDVSDDIPSLAVALDEPTANGSFFAVQAISRLARTRATVVLSGDGGDELFAGYNRYALTWSAWQKLRWVPARIRRGVRKALAAMDHRVLAERRGGLMSLLPFGSQASAGSVLAKLERLLEAGDYRQCYDLVTSCWPPGAPLTGAGHRERVWCELPGISALLLSDQLDYLPGDSLAKVDRASMAVSLETRLPLLDHRLVEFSWRVPETMKRRDGKSKWLMRAVLDGFVPRALTDRKKMGFTVPVDRWLSGSLREWAHEALRSAAFRDLMGERHALVLDAWERYATLRRPSGYQIWALVVLAAWCNQRTDRGGHPAAVQPAIATVCV